MDKKKVRWDEVKAVVGVFTMDLVIFLAIVGYVYFVRMKGGH